MTNLYNQVIINRTEFCTNYAPCQATLAVTEYLNLSSVLNNKVWLTSQGSTFIQMQRTCDAVLFESNFASLNMASQLAFGIFAIIASLLSLVTNIGIILTINNDPDLNKVGGVVFKNLAAADLLFAFIGGMIIGGMQLELVVALNQGSPANFLNRVIYNVPLNFALGYILRVSLVTSMIFMCGSVFDRYKRISKPFQYKAKQTQLVPMIRKLSTAVWFIVAVLYIYPMTGHWAYFTMSPYGPFVSNVASCTASDGTSGIWFFRSVLIVGLFIVLLTLVWSGIYAWAVAKAWKDMSKATKESQARGGRIDVCCFLMYTAPCFIYICSAMQYGVLLDPGLLTFLVVFFLLRGSCVFFVYFLLRRTFYESAKSLVRETIPRKIQQFRYRFGFGEL